MTEEIHKIVMGYINDGDYEKALSLLKNLKLEDDTDKAMLESCKKKFTDSCTTAIADAVKSKNKEKAESILSSYQKTIGDDSNTILFQTLIDSIKKDGVSPLSNLSYTNLQILISEIFKNCIPNRSILYSKAVYVGYVLLALALIICSLIFRAHITYYIATIVVATALAILTFNSPNIRFKAVGLILLLIPTIIAIVVYKSGLPFDSTTRAIAWLSSIIFVAIFNVFIRSKSVIFRIITSILIFTVLNPMLYGMNFSPGVFEGRWFSSDAKLLIVSSTVATLIIYYFSLFGFKRAWCILRPHKKKISIVLASIAAICVLTVVAVNLKESYDLKVAQEQAREKARQDAIRAEEEARRAAIEQARQDSIAAVRRREQARRDSIDYVEHADFVSKYSKIGLIIYKLKMTRGKNSDGVPTKGIEFSVFNPTHKTIKYVIANLHAVNKFNDRVSYNERCRGIGPIESHDFGTWSFEDVFTDKNDIIEDLSVSFTVEYTNGTSKTIRWKDAYDPDFKASWFYGR